MEQLVLKILLRVGSSAALAASHVSVCGNTSDLSLQNVQLPGSYHLTKHTLLALYTTYWHLLCIVMLALVMISPAATHHMC